MNRKPKAKTFTFAGQAWTGKTVAEAKENAAADLARLMNETGSLRILRYRHYVVLVWRQRYGWGYKIMDDLAVAVKVGSVRAVYGTTGSMDNEEAAVRAARRHLAQWASNPAANDDCLDVIDNDSDRRDHKSWCEWQRRFAAFKLMHDGMGLTDGEIRQRFDMEELGHRTA